MKYFLTLSIGCCLLALSACKKDSGVEEPAPLPDFSGLYYIKGNIEIQSNPVEKIPFNWVVTASDQGKYHVGPFGAYNSSAYRWTISGIYSWLADVNEFQVIVYGGALQGNNSSDAHWTVEELKAIFQPGKQLNYGTGFGQVGVEMSGLSGWPGEYWSLWADNSANHVIIEEVNDLENYFPGSKWVKQVVIRFDLHLEHVFSSTPSPAVEMKNCRASLLFQPIVD